MRQLCLNYNSIIVLLTQRMENDLLKREKVQRMSSVAHTVAAESKRDDIKSEMGVVREPRMGGVHLYN
jgi:hypothetical protein